MHLPPETKQTVYYDSYKLGTGRQFVVPFAAESQEWIEQMLDFVPNADVHLHEDDLDWQAI